MSSSDDGAISLAKVVLWQEAKGKLRAIVAAEGQCPPDHIFRDYRAISAAVEEFIQKFEGEGFHE